MNTVFIPCFDRPEFLHVCIEQIQKADKWNEQNYIISADFGYNPECFKVVERLLPDATFVEMPNLIGTQCIKIMKQSLNVLNGLRMAADVSDALVYLIEDDVMIGKDFFTMHEAIHAQQPDIFCSIATRNHNSRFVIEPNENMYYVSPNVADYQSLGVCYKKEMLSDYVLPHLNLSYTMNPHVYCSSIFPGNSIGYEYCEQDGLIRRIKEKHSLHAAFMNIPRAFHAGYYGKNRGKRNRLGTLDTQVSIVKSIIFDKSKMRKHCENEYFYFDSEPVELNTKHTEVIQCRELNQ